MNDQTNKPTTPAAVQIGTCANIELVYRSGQREALAFDLVADEAADIESGFLGVNTPIAKAGILSVTARSGFCDEAVSSLARRLLTCTAFRRKCQR